jgi:hypothetical protein
MPWGFMSVFALIATLPVMIVAFLRCRSFFPCFEATLTEPRPEENRPLSETGIRQYLSADSDIGATLHQTMSDGAREGLGMQV